MKKRLRPALPMKVAVKSTSSPTTRAGWNPSELVATDISTIEIDNDHDLVIELMVPVRDDAGEIELYAEYTETIPLDDTAPGYLMAAARALAEATVQALRQRENRSDTVPCETCIGNCCGISDEASNVQVLREDVERIVKGVGNAESITLYAMERWDGVVGELKKAEIEFNGEAHLACVHLRTNGCSIYEHRPRVCREYVAWTCEIHVEDQAKVDGKVHLRVAR